MNSNEPGSNPEHSPDNQLPAFGSGIAPERADAESGEWEMQALRRIAAEFDAPPSLVDELAMAAFETRNLDLQLASLMADSENGSELVRSVSTESRMVSFEVGEISVELQLRHTEAGVALNGLVMGAEGTVLVETVANSLEVQIDESGWFSLDGVVAGMLRLKLISTDGTGVMTEWIST